MQKASGDCSRIGREITTPHAPLVSHIRCNVEALYQYPPRHGLNLPIVSSCAERNGFKRTFLSLPLDFKNSLR